MLMQIRMPLCAAAAILIAGCANLRDEPTEAQAIEADYGAKPVHYEQVVHQYFEQTLKDPSSVQYRSITEPEKGWIQHWRGLVGGGMQRTFGWRVLATINAKNSYGGYVGFQTYQFIFRGEEIADSLDP